MDFGGFFFFLKVVESSPDQKGVCVLIKCFYRRCGNVFFVLFFFCTSFIVRKLRERMVDVNCRKKKKKKVPPSPPLSSPLTSPPQTSCLINFKELPSSDITRRFCFCLFVCLLSLFVCCWNFPWVMSGSPELHFHKVCKKKKKKKKKKGAPPLPLLLLLPFVVRNCDVPLR